MAAFFYEWDDFGGGYYVGPSAVNQPKNTWQGENVTLSEDDATLVPTYEPTRIVLTGTGTSGGSLSNSTSLTSWSDPTYFNGYVVLVGLTSTNTYVYFINTSSGAVNRIDLGVVGTVPSNTSSNSPVVVPVGNDVVAYVAIGTTAIYQVTRSTSAVVAITPSGNTTLLTGLTIWNARMIAWGSSSDTFLFSNALDFGTTWSSLNFVGVGYANDGISYCIPRNLDMIVVKPSGWYSITGILGASTAVRQMNDTLGVLPSDPVTQHNNTVYFSTSTSPTNYAVNLMAISGTRVDVAAYQRFGLEDSNLQICKTNMGFLGAIAQIKDVNAVTYARLYLLNSQDRWQIIQFQAYDPDDGLKFAVARGQVSRYNTTEDQVLYVAESTTGSFKNTLSLHRVRPTTIEPGKLKNSSTDPSSATLRLPDITTKTPVIIRTVFVEAEILQLPVYSYTGSAKLQAKVNIKALGDIGFNDDIDSSSGLSTAYEYPFSSFTSVSNTSVSQTRVLRFNVNNACYGYVNEIELKFSGLRIRRVWVEGDSR